MKRKERRPEERSSVFMNQNIVIMDHDRGRNFELFKFDKKGNEICMACHKV